MSSYADVDTGPAPRSDDALRKAAASQVDLEINQAVAPIQSQIATTQKREERSLGQIGGMFDAIQPVVNQGTKAVQASYDQAQSQETALFANAQANFQKARADRAADAQSMAQNIGGPVAINDWTQPYTDASGDLAMLGAGQQLHTLAYAQAGVQEASQFSGQIMPLVRTEQMASVRNQFEDQIREYQDQITALKSQKGAQVNKRYNELRTQELQYGLQRATLQLQRIDAQQTHNLEVKKTKAQIADANRNYNLDVQQYKLQKQKQDNDLKVALITAGNDTRRVDLAYKQYFEGIKEWSQDYDLRYGSQYGHAPGSTEKTLAAIQRDDQIDQFAKTYGLDAKKLKADIANQLATTKIQQQQLDSTQNSQWVDLFDMAVNPQPGKTVTTTQQVPIPTAKALQAIALGDTDILIGTDKNGKTIYYKNQTVTSTVPNNMQPITDPNRLVDWMVTGMHDPDFDKSRAESLIHDRFPELEQMGWHHYGDKWPPTDPKTKKREPTSAKGETFQHYIERILPEGTKLQKAMADATGTSTTPGAPWHLQPSNTAKPTASAAAKGTSQFWSADKDPIVAPGPPNTGLHKTKSGRYVNQYGMYTKWP
jgi:hypothetical protein